MRAHGGFLEDGAVELYQRIARDTQCVLARRLPEMLAMMRRGDREPGDADQDAEDAAGPE
ncbi:MAG: hypothetical protein K2X78_11335 [Burkholderiaceae bacterium]|nr:hypothetical protein [Burkholderiaceae bacterium]